MRYVLIVNPAAGKKNPLHTVFPEVRSFFEKNRLPFRSYVTERPRQATEIARGEGEKGGDVRIFGLGGDGTLGEIAAGVMNMENVEIGVFPCGSGDDYIKCFGTRSDFLSPQKQLEGKSVPVDMIRSDKEVSINLCSVGMDAKVGYDMAKFKNLPFVSGPMSYNLALVKNLLGKIGEDLQVTIDGAKKFSGRFLFALAGSGRYYGGGYCGAPKAVPGDGLLDFVLVRKPQFRKIPRLVGIYKAGRHVESQEFRGLLTYCRGRRMEIAATHEIPANFDGECRLLRQTCFEVVRRPVRFIVPC